MKAKINNLELSSTLFLLIFSCTLGIAPLISIRICGINSYISVLIGGLIGIIPLCIFLYIFNYEIDKPINKKTKIIFGKVLGTIINFLSIPFILLLGITQLFNISNFVISQYLTNTPLLLIIIVIAITSLYIANKGIKIITKTSFIYAIIILIIFVIAILGLLPEVKIDNLKPILEFGIKKPLIAGLINSLNFSIPIYTLLSLPKAEIENNKKATKCLFLTYILSIIVILSIAIVTSAILGKYLLNIYQYPVYITLKRISLFKFIDRIENFLSLQWILSGLITISMTIYSVSKNIKNKDSKILNLIIAIIMILLAYFLFKNNTSFNEYLYKMYPYTTLLPLIIIYVIIFIGAILKKKLKK